MKASTPTPTITHTITPVTLNDDVIGIIEDYADFRCMWCKKKISVFNLIWIKVGTVYFCDKYCSQWL